MDDQQAGQSGGVNLKDAGPVTVQGSMVGRDSISINVQGIDPAVLKKAEARLDEFMDRLVELRHRLQEWKSLHNSLQELQHRFTVCHGLALALSSDEPSPGVGVLSFLTNTPASQARKAEKRLYEFSANWESCKRDLDNLRRATQALTSIVNDYPPGHPNRPDILLAALDRMRQEIDGALHDQDRYNLTDLIGAFAKQVDDGL